MLNLAAFLHEVRAKSELDPELSEVIESIVTGIIAIEKKVHLGSLAGILGTAGTDNIQGEEQKKLDVLANQILLATLQKNHHVAGMASEEEDHFVAGHEDGRYLVLFDPLDGSSNVDIDAPVGTIFSVLARENVDTSLTEEEFLQPGKKQLAAGFALYGPQTVLALTIGAGVMLFTLDAENHFILTQRDVKIAAQASEFALNFSNRRHWHAATRAYADELLEGAEGPRKKNYNLRWIACLVSEVARILQRGGVFLYPEDERPGMERGKLRLLYEANPMSLLIAAAGGDATNGKSDILSITPEKLHQRVPLILGAPEEVAYYRQKQKDMKARNE